MKIRDVVYSKPNLCKLCEGRMVFKGVGEYRCEICNNLEYDDYGKVRNYIEKNHGATIVEIENAVKVNQRIIRQMLKEERFEITENSKVFLSCEVCGKDILYGKLCGKCSLDFDKIHTESLAKRNAFKGTGLGSKNDIGEKRFKR